MRPMRLLLPLVLLATPLASQDRPPRLEVGADFSYWELDRGTASVGPTTRQSGTLRMGLLVPTRRPASVGVSATYAPEDGLSPGLLVVSGELSQRLFPDIHHGFNLFVAGGAGALRFSSDEQRQILEACRIEDGCMREGYSHDEHWRTVLTGSVGADVPLAGNLLLQPTIALIKPVLERDDLPALDTMFRLGIGFTLRP